MRFFAALILLFLMMPSESRANEKASINGVYAGMPMSELTRLTGLDYFCQLLSLNTYADCFVLGKPWRPTIAGQRCTLNTVHAFAGGMEIYDPDEFKIYRAHFSCDFADESAIAAALNKKYGWPQNEEKAGVRAFYWTDATAPHVRLYKTDFLSAPTTVYVEVVDSPVEKQQRALQNSRTASDI